MIKETIEIGDMVRITHIPGTHIFAGRLGRVVFVTKQDRGMQYTVHLLRDPRWMVRVYEGELIFCHK